MRSSLVSRSSLLVSLAALFVAVGGAAYAGIEVVTSSAVIHACVSNKTGAIRVAKRCRAKERPLTWDRAAPSGSSAGYYKTIYNPRENAPATATVIVAPGGYIANGGCTAKNGQAITPGAGQPPVSFQAAFAFLTATGARHPGGPFEFDAAASVPNQGDNSGGHGTITAGYASLYDSGGFALPKGGRITQSCNFAGIISEIHLTAIRVDSLHGSTTDEAIVTP